MSSMNPTPGVQDNRTHVVYADIVGQEGTTTKQLFDDPPAGYRFVSRRKLSNRISDSVSTNWTIPQGQASR